MKVSVPQFYSHIYVLYYVYCLQAEEFPSRDANIFRLHKTSDEMCVQLLDQISYETPQVFTQCNINESKSSHIKHIFAISRFVSNGFLEMSGYRTWFFFFFFKSGKENVKEQQ